MSAMPRRRFQPIAQTLERRSNASPTQLRAELARRCPEIVQQIDSDGQTPQLLRLWGQSLNRDEITGTTIVAPHILGAIGDIAGLACDSDVVHAGLQHTYGYLFSTIETPFGFKRDRWVKPELEQGLGITEPAIRPHPSSGTLLGNLTYLLGRIAFRGRSRELRVLRSLRELVSPAITGFPFAKQAVVRVAETVRLRNSRVVSIQSDFVQLTKSRATNSDFLLVYSFRDSSSSLGQLITAFPVTAPFVLDFAASETLGMRPVRTRFNGYLDGLSGKQLRGERTLTLISGQCPSSLHGCLGEQ